MDSKSLSHTKWKCQYYVVFIPKYRRKVMYGQVKKDVREIIQTLCEYKKVNAGCEIQFETASSANLLWCSWNRKKS